MVDRRLLTQGDYAMTGAYRTAVILVLALALPAWCQAQTTTPTTSPTTSPATTQAAASNGEDFDALVKRLGSTDWKERQLAEQGIVKMGTAVVPRVEELGKKSADPEVQQRAKAIVRQIAMASLTEPTLVTLKFKNAPAGEVYADLFKQVGAQIELWPPNLFAAGARPIPAVTIDVNKVPFWEAISKLEAQTGLFPRSMGDQMRLSERRMGGINNGRKREVCVTGPFMVTTDDTFPMLTEIKVFVEPRVRMIGHAAEPKIEEVTDEKGNPVALDGFGRGGRMPQQMVAAIAARGARMEQSGGSAFSMRLMRPIPAGGSVRGSLKVSVMTEDQTIEIADVAKASNVDRVIDGRRILLSTTKIEPSDWYITLAVYDTNPPTPGLSGMRLDILDTNGRPLKFGGMRGMSSSSKAFVLCNACVQGPNDGPPATLRMLLPKKSREIDVPFEFGGKPGGKVNANADANERGDNPNDKAAAQQ
jgi:hypothetical protein